MRKRWIDALRGIAIVAVVLGHTMQIMPLLKVKEIYQHVSFTIPWFIFLAGVTTVYAVQKSHNSFIYTHTKIFLRHVLNIFPIYILALLVAIKLSAFPSFSDVNIPEELILFRYLPTFYFIPLIFQLYLFSPLFVWISAFKQKYYIWGALCVIIYISFFSHIVSYPLPYYLHQGIIIGGGYLVIFFLGIWYGKKQFTLSTNMFLITALLFCILDYVFFTYFFIRTNSLPYFLLLQSWSMLLLFLVKTFSEHIPQKVLSPFAFLGRYSLFIFLFHFQILLYMISRLPPGLPTFYISFTGSIVLSILIGLVYKGSIQKIHTIRSKYHIGIFRK